MSYVEEASDVRDGTDIEMQLTFDSQMRIVLAKYALDGTWLGMEEMSTQVTGCMVVFALVAVLLFVLLLDCIRTHFQRKMFN